MSPAPRVKICGLTRLEDARHAADLGAWALGLIFHAPSPRACDPRAAGAIGAALRRRVEICGVFVNAPLDVVVAHAEAIPLSLLQLHGEEGPSYCAAAAGRTGCRVIKAARVRSGADIQALGPYKTDFHLLDAHRPGARGGTGATWNWELLRGHHGPVPLIASGGLRPENVGEAIAATRPWGVDAASGLEAEPGRKDPERVEAFFAAVAATAAAATTAAAG
jgi:phosphoribosylanthranilate isomerase